ncbi:MAG: VCBS repeat-containing protein [Rhodocyclaceae bacterium]|nr:VCBS repeat-containing protein [Rhodocyclaceae bacterium]
MKIANAAVSMQSQHAAATRHEERETLRAWIGRERPDFEGQSRRPSPPPPPPPVNISEAGKAARSAEAQAIESAADAVDNDPFLFLIRSMVEMLTGRAVRVFDASELQGGAAESIEAPDPQQSEAPSRPAGFGIEVEYHAVHEEIEQTDFSAKGVVRTADGREIAFKLDLSMTRHFREETNLSLFAGDAKRKDPLVINFGGTAAQLFDQRFRFDLDADGQAEDVPLLGGGSGYLALDLNGNGKIDSGAELFGPKSGAGFAELAGYDRDGNGWIDEGDAVFDRLLVWTPAEKGAGTLSSLKDRDVGALFLGRIGTPFELRGEANSDLGAVRASGLYLTEAGRAGTLQEIDLTV